MERMESGIPGLDKMIQGGFPFPSIVLVGGEPGTGKTTLALQSLFYGAERGEQGLYITAISEPTWVVQKFLGEFAFYSQKIVEMEKIVFVDIDGSMSEDSEKIMDVLKKNIEKYEPKRVVIDPITAIKNALSGTITYRKFLHDLMVYLKTQGCVTLLITEYSYSDVPRSVDAYMADALIILSYLEIENARKKYLEVLKMRGTKHLTGRRSLVISDEGLRVQPELR
ncbi:MAG: KaiA-binding protein [Candidatus Altiarchaeales archaeon]|nr:MAG: KaiA-binding protein [Candidatus Altiarchaeales archaeon]